MLALVRRLVPAPHLQADLQRLLQPLEPLRDRRERDAQPAGLLVVPGRPDAEPGPAAGEHVEGGHDLRQDPGMPVHHASHQGDQLGAGRACRQVPERGVGLQHLALGRPDRADLEEVVHHRDEVESRVVRGAGDSGQVRPEPGWSARRGEVRDLQSNLHELPPGQRLSHVGAWGPAGSDRQATTWPTEDLHQAR
jgi:hypothetical protein